jgi:anti-anti-sigma factor
MNLRITLWERDDEDLLDVRGVIDFASAPYLRQVIFERFNRGRYRIVVDLTHVRLVDASALRVLLYLQRRAEQGGGTLRTPGATGTALTALEIAGVAKQFDAYTEPGPAGRTGAGRPVDLELSDEAVTEAIALGQNSRPLSLDLATRTSDGENTTLLDHLGGEDPQLSCVDYHESLQVLLARLPERSQKVIALRFHGGLAQHEIAEQIGLSQMQVSRILRQSLATLRHRLEND